MGYADETIDSPMELERHPLEVLAEQFSSAIRRGLKPNIEEFAKRVPEQQEEAVALLKSIQLFENAASSISSSSNSPSKLRIAAPMPESFGDFRIIAEIGRGGMGVIYEAEQVSLKRRVALKVLGNVADSLRHIERFHRESEAVARLHHTNIVPVFAVGEESGIHYFAMQLIHGKPLNQIKNLSMPEIARVGVQAANALAYAHSRGVLHRDIKPSNLLFDNDANVWVTDFGLAKLSDVGELTQTGDIMGTLKYMAPEQLTGESDERSDVYSLGLTLYELATGKPAFDLSRSLIDRIKAHAFPSPRSINPDIPKDLETILLKATSLERPSRYQTAEELEEDLRRFLEDRPIQARRESSFEKLHRWVRRNPALAVSISASFLFLATTAILAIGGYVTTNQALRETSSARDAEKQAKNQAKIDQARAESNLAVAMSAFDAIFDNVATRGIPVSLTLDDSNEDADETMTRSYSALTSKDAELLTQLLDFYRVFAKQNESDNALLYKTALAFKRCGQIQQRLGRVQDAMTSFEETLRLLDLFQSKENDEVNIAIAKAQTRNEQGTAFAQSSNNIQEIVSYHHEAAFILRELSRTEQSSPAVRFELARSLDLAGSLMSRTNAFLATESMPVPSMRQPDNSQRPRGNPNGFGPDGPMEPPFGKNERPFFGGGPRNGQGPQQQPFNPDGPPHVGPRPDGPPHDGPPPDGPRGNGNNTPPRMDNFSNGPRNGGNRRFGPGGMPPDMQGKGQGNGKGPGNMDHLGSIIDGELEEAVELFNGLSNEFPDREDYALALSRALMHRMRHNIMWRNLPVADASFQRAQTKLQQLVKDHPNTPQYLVELAEVLVSSSSLGKERGDPIERFQRAQHALEIAQQLNAAFPDIEEYQILVARCEQKMGILHREQGEYDQAYPHFEKTYETMQRLHQRFPTHRVYIPNQLFAAFECAQINLIRQTEDASVSLDENIQQLLDGLKPLHELADKDPAMQRMELEALRKLMMLYRATENEAGVAETLEKMNALPPQPSPNAPPQGPYQRQHPNDRR